MRRLWLAAAVVAVWGLSVGHSSGAVSQDNQVAQVAEKEFYSADPFSIGLSPSGEFLSYLKQPLRRFKQAGYDDYAGTLLVRNLRDGSVQQLPGSHFSVEGPKVAWSPNNRWLAYFSYDESGVATLQVWEVGSRRVVWRTTRSMRNAGRELSFARWTADGRSLLFLAYPPTTAPPISGVKYNPDTLLNAELHGWVPSASGMTILRPGQEKPQVPAPAVVAASVVSADIGSGEEQVLFTEEPGEMLIEFAPAPQGEFAVVVAIKVPDQNHTFFWRVPLKSTPARKLLAGPLPVSYGNGFSFSPSGQRLAVTTVIAPDGLGDVLTIDVQNGQVRNLTERIVFPEVDEQMRTLLEFTHKGKFGSSRTAPLWAGEEALIVIHAAPSGDRERPVNVELWRIKTDGSGGQRLTQGLSVTALALCTERLQPCLMGKQRDILARARSVDTQKVAYWVIDPVTGRSRHFKALGTSVAGETAGVLENAVTGPDGWLLFGTPQGAAIGLEQTIATPPELWHFDIERAGAARELKVLNAGSAPAPVTFRRLSGFGPRGTDHATLLLPPGLRKGERPPVIQYLYYSFKGDAQRALQLFNSGDDIWTPFLTQGRYAVLIPEIPLTPGRGHACDNAAAVAIAALDAAAATGLVDTERVGVYGESLGAYLSSCVATRTSRIRAAVIASGVTDLVHLCLASSTHCSGFVMQPGGNLWQVRDNYINDSQPFHLDRVTAAVLLVYGKDDRPVMADQLIAFYNGLAGLGRKVELVAYDNKSHDASSHPDYMPRVLNWYRQHLERPAGH